MYDALIIGGGFYGASIAVALAQEHGLKRVALVERHQVLLSRASYSNQARIHNGYHYPRSFTTAYRSRLNLPLFVRDYPTVVRHDFTKVYAVARRNSKVTARQFRGFCAEIGARLEPAPTALRELFNPRLIEEVFLADEYAFDAAELALLAQRALAAANVDVLLGTEVTAILPRAGAIDVTTAGTHAATLRSTLVFNCTYSGLNHFAETRSSRTLLKHEISEMALMDVPPLLKNLGVTVMDGAFFSMMPFPSRHLHTLSHVRYTPHCSWQDEVGSDPYAILANYPKITRVDRMVRDVARYLPAIRDARYRDSLFEVKTVLAKNETDDGRPILFEKHSEIAGLYSILGGKIDNIYDCLEALRMELHSTRTARASLVQ